MCLITYALHGGGNRYSASVIDSASKARAVSCLHGSRIPRRVARKPPDCQYMWPCQGNFLRSWHEAPQRQKIFADNNNSSIGDHIYMTFRRPIMPLLMYSAPQVPIASFMKAI